MKIQIRDAPPRSVWALQQAGIHPLLAQLYAARGVQTADELDDGLGRLLPPASLLGAAAAAVLLADSIATGNKICVVADYDCDGATACAVASRRRCFASGCCAARTSASPSKPAFCAAAATASGVSMPVPSVHVAA